MPRVARNRNPLDEIDRALGLSPEEADIIGNLLINDMPKQPGPQLARHMGTGIARLPAIRGGQATPQPPVADIRAGQGNVPPAPTMPEYRPPEDMPWWKKALAVGLGAAEGAAGGGGAVYHNVVTRPQQQAQENYEREVGEYEGQMEIFQDTREHLARERDRAETLKQRELENQLAQERLGADKLYREGTLDISRGGLDLRRQELERRALEGDRQAEIELRELAMREQDLQSRLAVDEAQAERHRQQAALYGRTDPNLRAGTGGPTLAQRNQAERWRLDQINRIRQQYQDYLGFPAADEQERRFQAQMRQQMQAEIAAIEASYRQQISQPNPNEAPPPPTQAQAGQTLTKEVAAQYLQAAGGDRAKAEQLAREDGWEF